MEGDSTMTSMWSQSAPQLSMRSASDAKLAKSDDSIDGAIFGDTPISDLLTRFGLITGLGSEEERSRWREMTRSLVRLKSLKRSRFYLVSILIS